MKRNNILSTVCFLGLALSCSMEDDPLKEFDSSNKANKDMAGEASIAFNAVLSSTSLTKSVTDKTSENPTDQESQIDNCTLILAETDAAGTILAIREDVFVNRTSSFTADGKTYTNVVVATSGSSEQMIRHLVKVGRKYQVMIIANASKKLSASTTLRAVEKEVQEGMAGSLVKVGRAEVDLTNEKGYASTSESAQHPIFVTVKLQQLAARIELAGFTVKDFINETLPSTVIIKKIVVSNINMKSALTEKAEYSAGQYVTDSKEYEGGVTVYTVGSELNKMYSFVDNQNVHPFYSYRNRADATDKLKMTVYYTVGGVAKVSKPFVINGKESGGTGSIDSNTIYRLYVTASVTSDELVLNTVKCLTADWNKVDVNAGSLKEE